MDAYTEKITPIDVKATWSKVYKKDKENVSAQHSKLILLKVDIFGTDVVLRVDVPFGFSSHVIKGRGQTIDLHSY
mgnify:CR=1 FL=1